MCALAHWYSSFSYGTGHHRAFPWHLKCMLEKQKQGMCGETPQSGVTKALYTLNHLTVPANSQNPVILNHFLLLQSPSDVHSPKPKVLIKNLLTNKWEGPWDRVTWGCLYFHECWHPMGACWVCVSCSRLCSGSHPTTSPWQPHSRGGAVTGMTFHTTVWRYGDCGMTVHPYLERNLVLRRQALWEQD